MLKFFKTCKFYGYCNFMLFGNESFIRIINIERDK